MNRTGTNAHIRTTITKADKSDLIPSVTITGQSDIAPGQTAEFSPHLVSSYFHPPIASVHPQLTSKFHPTTYNRIHMFSGWRSTLLRAGGLAESLRPSLFTPGLRNLSTETLKQVTTSNTIRKPALPANLKVVLWKMYAQFHPHNTICSFVAVVEDPDFIKNNSHLSYNQQVLYYMRLPHYPKIHLSAGMLGFRKSNRAEYEAGYQVSTNFFKMIEEKKLLAPNDKIEVIMSDFGKGRDAFISALNGKEGSFVRPHVSRVTDATKLKFGGVRSKKLRRL